MTEAEWTSGFGRCLGLLLRGDAMEEVDERGAPVSGDTFLVLLNAHPESVPFVLPAHGSDARWMPVLDTHGGETADPGPERTAGEPCDLRGRSLVVLRLRPGLRTREE